MDQEEKEIILLISIDMKDAFETLVSCYVSKLYYYALYLLKSEEEAEDMVQEAFTQAYVALENYSPERIRSLHLSAWLFTIVKNLCLNRIRDKGQKNVIYFPEVDYGEFEIATQDLPENITEQKELEEEIATLISRLPSSYQQVLSLYYFKGYDYKEIASHLNIPIGTVKSYLSRGKEKLRSLLAIQRDEVQ